MGGRLEVKVDYDSTTITIEGKASEFDKIIEVLHNAVISTQFGPDVVDRVKKSRTKMLWETSVSPSMTADRAVSSRLFGDFPYGRPAAGDLEEITKVERGDLMLARDRFLNSNNATIVIAGGITPSRTLRTLRQLLGAWRKSEQIVPTTFRQPKAADPRVLLIKVPTETAEVRLAVRGLARSDADAAAAEVLAKILYQRWVEAFPMLARKAAFARSETHVLPGIFTIGTGIEESHVADAIASAKKTIDSVLTTPATSAELDRAKNLVVAENAALSARPGASLDPWLDQRTFKLKGVPDVTAQTMAITANDIQRVAGRLFKDTGVASVVIGDTMHLKTVLEGRFPYEVLGEVQTTTAPVKPAAKPAASPSPR
jgi:zinc protease